MFRRRTEFLNKRPLLRMCLIHPFELLIATWSLLSGIPISFGVRLSNSASAHLPNVIYNTWGVMLTLSGATVLTGLIMFFGSRNAVRKVIALRIEQCGWTLLCCGVGVFTATLLTLAIQGAVYTTMADLAVIIAGGLRIASLSQAAQAYKRAIRNVISSD